MVSADAVITELLARAGGFVELDAARGGATSFGVSASTLGRFRKLGRPATKAEVRALTEAEARKVYESWHLVPWALLPEPLRGLCCDFGLNTSHIEVKKQLQLCLQELRFYTGAIDGVVGKQTTKPLLAHGGDPALYRAMLIRRQRYHLEVALDTEVASFLRRCPTTQLHHLEGWLARTQQFILGEPSGEGRPVTTRGRSVRDVTA